MSVGDWTPEHVVAQQEIDSGWLKQCVQLGLQDSLETMADQLGEAEVRAKAACMRLPAEQWQRACAGFGSDELVALIRFFTRAEMLLPGWDAGKDSPAIALNKLLRQRGEKLSRDTLLWIRQHSDNRYIPNGGL